jgi:hypothetical protein
MDDRALRAYWGTTRALIRNMVEGVTKGYEKKLEVVGVGWTAAVQGKKLKLVGRLRQPHHDGHPQGLTVSVEKQIVKISGADKQLPSASSPPRCAPSASPSPTTARASSTPKRSSSASRASSSAPNPERAARPTETATWTSTSTKDTPPPVVARHPQAHRGHPGPPAPRDLQVPEPHLRPDHRRPGRHHPRRASTRDKERLKARPDRQRRRGRGRRRGSPSGPRRPGSARSSSTAAGSGTTGASRRSPTRPARPVSSSETRHRTIQGIKAIA